MWNPSTGNPFQFLTAHNAAVQNVIVNEAASQLISIGVDKVVKVWDARNFRCMQSIENSEAIKDENIACVLYDPEAAQLVLGSRQLTRWPLYTKKESTYTHRAAITACKYNDVFHSVVSADSSGTVCVWNVLNGLLSNEFHNTHGDYKITCVSFCIASGRRRLLTASTDGTVKLWNFSSGEHLATYVKGNSVELSGLLTCTSGRGDRPNVFTVAVGLL